MKSARKIALCVASLATIAFALQISSIAYADAAAKSATAPGAAVSAKKKESGYVGDKMTHKFHKPSCASVAAITAENKVTFKTKTEAEKAGFTADPVCIKTKA